MANTEAPPRGGYQPAEIEPYWQAQWLAQGTFTAEKLSPKPKYYVLDMFPYPSGAGLHVGHPLGYIATDIIARYKKLKGYNVLHPMGFDAFGLPAENYAIQTGTHPAITTERNITRFKEQLGRLGMAYDPEAELRTSDPAFFKWTQWIFLKLFSSWFNTSTRRAEPIEALLNHLDQKGTEGLSAWGDPLGPYSAQQWRALSEKNKNQELLKVRLATLSYDYVNWCPALGTVLANEEVKDGRSERGGHPVERKQMRQWSLRITAYADRLLQGLETLDWPQALKEQQRHWIGRSVGASLAFQGQQGQQPVEVFTTRPDTLFGCTFLVLAPEHPLITAYTSAAQQAAVVSYQAGVAGRSERERQAETKTMTGVFTGGYVKHPFTQEPLPVWVADYVLMGYGTGAIMAVPGHDERDWAFARQFGLPIAEVVAGGDVTQAAHHAKDGVLVNSQFLDGMPVAEAIQHMINELERRGLGRGRVAYRLRDAVFSRQRYWGEPFPIAYSDDMPQALPESQLPVTLPAVESYQPTGTGAGPLAAVETWVNLPDGRRRETDTMPGWAGSSWYWLRYPDAHNSQALADAARIAYWMPVDLYLGGAEHAVGHLLYSRFWSHFLHDLGVVPVAEPFSKLVNQGMIQGRSAIIHKLPDSTAFVSADSLVPGVTYTRLHVDVSLVKDDVLDVDAYRKWRPEYADAHFTPGPDGLFRCSAEVEKMSKSLYNVVNPDDICQEYGADVFRLYEMFLGPLEQHKPWSTQGITGVQQFVRRLWRLMVAEDGQLLVTDGVPDKAELRLLHQTIQKVEHDCENLSFNTTVPQFMIFVNELTRTGCRKRALLEPFLIIMAPYAPHLAEELWHRLGHTTLIAEATYPAYDPELLHEEAIEYPVSVNGKVRARVSLPREASEAQVQAAALALPEVQKYIGDVPPKRVVVVPGRIVNVVV